MKKENKSKSKVSKGFSLAEMLVAMSVFIIIITATISVFVSVANMWKKTRNIQANLASSRTSSELISKTIRMSSLLQTANGGPTDSQIMMYNNSQNKCISYRFEDNLLELSEFVPGVDTECSNQNNYSTWKTMSSAAEGTFTVKKTSLEAPYAIGKATLAMNIGGTQTQTSISFRDYQGIIQTLDTGNDESTKLLIQSEADDNSQAFEDTSIGGGHQVTAHGDVKHKVGEARFGNSSIYFDGDNDYLSIDDTTDLNVGEGNFTFDFQVKLTNNSGTKFFFSGTSAGDAKPAASYDNGTVYFYIGTSNFVSWSKTLDQNTWYHLAFVRSEGDMLFFVNGKKVGASQALNTSIPATNLKIGIAAGDANDFQGYMEEFRFSNVARWTNDFPPVTKPYGVDVSICGDTDCTGAESCSSCPDDCGVCSLCGDGECNGTENCTYCAADCACTGGLVCSYGSCITPPSSDCGSTSSTTKTSCLAIKNDSGCSGSGSGTYWIKPAGYSAFQVYCDMTSDGGGWTLVARPYVSGSTLNSRNAVGTLMSPTQTTEAKLSDALINTIRGSYADSIIRINCGAGNAYFKENKEFNASAADSGAMIHASSSYNGSYSDCYPWTNHYGLNSFHNSTYCPDVPYTIYYYPNEGAGCYPSKQGVVYVK